MSRPERSVVTKGTDVAPAGAPADNEHQWSSDQVHSQGHPPCLPSTRAGLVS